MGQFMTRQWLTVSAALVAVAVATVAAVLVTSAQGGGNEARSAELVPADAPVFMTLNTDLTSDEWIATFRLIERMGIENPEQELRDSFEGEDGDLNWEEDVAPVLGGDIGIFVRAIDISGEQFDGAIIVRPADLTATKAIIEKGLDTLTAGEYEGVAYQTDEEGALAEIGEFIVLAASEEVLRDVIDVHRGAAPSLADADAFKELRSELPDDFLALIFTGRDALDMLAAANPMFTAASNSGHGQEDDSAVIKIFDGIDLPGNR